MGIRRALLGRRTIPVLAMVILVCLRLGLLMTRFRLLRGLDLRPLGRPVVAGGRGHWSLGAVVHLPIKPTHLRYLMEPIFGPEAVAPVFLGRFALPGQKTVHQPIDLDELFRAVTVLQLQMLEKLIDHLDPFALLETVNNKPLVGVQKALELELGLELCVAQPSLQNAQVLALGQRPNRKNSRQWSRFLGGRLRPPPERSGGEAIGSPVGATSA